MRKRSEAAKPASPKPSAVERTEPLPLTTKPDLVSHDGKVNCPTCEAIVMLGKCTKRDDGRFECCECGGVIDDITMTSSTKAEGEPPAAPVHAPEVDRMSPPVDFRHDVVHEGETSELIHEVPLSEIDAPPKNGGLAGYCSECGAAWPYLNGETLKACGHREAHEVDHPTSAKRIAPPAGQQRQDANSRRADLATRPQSVTNINAPAPPPSNRLSIPWGEARCPVDEWNNFKCGGMIITVDLPPGADRIEAAKAILSDLEQIADIAFQRQHAWYLKKLGKLGVPGF